MSLCGGGEMLFGLRGSSFEHIMNGLLFASTLIQLVSLYLPLTVPYLYPATTFSVVIEQKC